VIEVLGEPDLVTGLIVEGTNAASIFINIKDLTKYESNARWISFSYTPYESVEYLSYSGYKMRFKPYDNLGITFGPNMQLRSYSWSW